MKETEIHAQFCFVHIVGVARAVHDLSPGKAHALEWGSQTHGRWVFEQKNSHLLLELAEAETQ
jgi:hypothetical protein